MKFEKKLKILSKKIISKPAYNKKYLKAQIKSYNNKFSQ